MRINKWDSKHIDLMIAAEKKCRKIKTNDIDWLPIVGFYKRMIQIYRWIANYKEGRKDIARGTRCLPYMRSARKIGIAYHNMWRH